MSRAFGESGDCCVCSVSALPLFFVGFLTRRFFFCRKVSIVITRYQAPRLMPILASCLESLPNLHTLHVLHAHTQMTTAIRLAFEKVTLGSVKTLAVPDYSHEILRSCPNAIKVHCTAENGSKLVGAVGKRCKHLEEFAGLRPDGNMLKRASLSLNYGLELMFGRSCKGCTEFADASYSKPFSGESFQ